MYIIIKLLSHYYDLIIMFLPNDPKVLHVYMSKAPI